MMGILNKEASQSLVVLIHGFLGGRIQLVPVASMLRKKHDVLNYGYRSREDKLSGHANVLCETVTKRLELEKHEGISHRRAGVHFVTHSFGGVVLHRAFANGLGSILPSEVRTRCVLMAPPLRGVAFARAFRKDRLGGPTMMRNAVHAAAAGVLGAHSGAELMMNESKWYDAQLGTIPENVDVLVVAGTYGRINPLIDDESDGVVAVRETIMNRRHYRMEVPLTHNLLLYNGEVMRSVSSFLDGQNVGDLVEGKPYRPKTHSASDVDAQPLTYSKPHDKSKSSP